MADQEQSSLFDRLQRVAEALSAQSQATRLMLTNQKLEIEMLAKVLEAVTRKPEGDPLGELLTKLIHQSEEHGQKLDLIIQNLQPARD